MTSEITETMVEAALKIWFKANRGIIPEFGDDHASDMRASLEAALAARPAPEAGITPGGVRSVVERLRSQSQLAVCPYDRRSPDYWTAPNDKPCPMCGGEPEGPDKCTGADLRVMAEAADTIQSQAAAIAEREEQIRELEEKLRISQNEADCMRKQSIKNSRERNEAIRYGDDQRYRASNSDARALRFERLLLKSPEKSTVQRSYFPW